MRTFQAALVAAASFILCVSCGDRKGVSASAEASSLQTETSSAAAPARAKESTVVEKQKEAEMPLSFTVNCEEKEEVNPASEDPTILRTCTYGNYKTISTGSPDYKGRYHWEYQLYKADKGEYTEISNSALFNQRQSELLELVNQRIKTDHLKLLSDSETTECLEMREPIRDFQLDEMGISFEPDQVTFYVEFGLPDACRNVDGTWIQFKLEEIEPYLNK